MDRFISEQRRRLTRPTLRRASGFTLIELMVACAVAMLVLGSVAVIFAGTSSGRMEVERSGRLTENAAYAIELLSEDVRVAGYYAETRQSGVVWQVPNPCLTAIG